MKRFIIVLTLAIFALGAVEAKEPKKAATEKSGYIFTDITTLPTTPVRNQFRSGTCWCYSTLSFLEAEILRAGGEEVELSAMWIVRNIYFEKAVKYVRLHGSLNFAVGGAAHDVIHGIERYGIVPAEVYPGLNYGTDKPVFGEIDAVLKAYVDAIIRNPNRKLSTAWQAGLNGILDAYFGAMPSTFTYKGKEYTPQSFAASLPIDMADYVSFTSYTHEPFYKEFALEVPDNWMWGKMWNVPLDEMMAIVDNALANGYPLAWGADVSERGFSRTLGIGVMPEENVESMRGTEAERWGSMTKEEREKEMFSFKKPCPEKVITQQMRQEAYDNFETTDDHGMVIVGTAKDQTGTPFYRVQNSWGKRAPYDGFWYFSRSFVEYKTMDILVNRKAVPEAIAAKLK